MEKEFYIDLADEKFYENTFENGLKCFVFPKKNFFEKQVTFAVNYGSVDNIFYEDNKIKEEPRGIAHFIEHKLFEQEDYNVFEEFSKNGATSNAFTNFNTTAYYFNCTENFKKNCGILFDFVSKPLFTEENVKKEKDIISQEIKMYDDDPDWKIYFNMLKNMYFEHNIKNDIAGTVDSIKNITHKALYENYNNFYNYENSVIVCAGDFDRKELYSSILENLKLNEKDNNVKKILFNEKDEIANGFIAEKMNIERTMFNFGIKDVFKKFSISDRILSVKILLDIICGESSELYERLYEERLIDKSFSYAYTCGRDYGFAIISGFSESSEIVGEFLLDEVVKLKKSGIDKKLFELIKNKHIGRFIQGFNSIDGIVSAQVDFFTKNITLFDYCESLKNVSIDDVEKTLYELFCENNIVLSLIEH